MDYFRPRKQPDILDPLSPDFLKRKPAAASQPPQQVPQQGDLAPSSIFDEGDPQRKSETKTQAGQPRVSPRDPSVLAAALDPNPEARRRWQRNQIIRNVRNRGQLTKAQRIARTERESLSKSPFYTTSVKKLMPLARQIAGKPIEEAIVQMRFSKKKVARDVKKHLEYARDKAIVERGMGLGAATTEYNQAAGIGDSGDVTGENGGQDEKWPGMVVEDKKGKRRFVTDKSGIYVDEAWVGRGTYTVDYDYRAMGKVNILRPPETSITVRLKEEATRIRLMDEREQKRQRKKVWLPLPDRPVTAQRQFCLCTHRLFPGFPIPVLKLTVLKRENTFFSSTPSNCVLYPFFQAITIPFTLSETMSVSARSISASRVGPHDQPEASLFGEICRPTIILVHGGWQGPETYSLVLPRLEESGYSVVAVTLPSAGTVPATRDFSSDVSIIRNVVSSTLTTGKDVVLVMHSYGAVPGCEALKGIKQDEAKLVMESDAAVKVGRIIKLAFIAALLFPEGKATWNEGRGNEPVPGFACEDDLIRCTDGPKRFYNDLPPQMALRWATRLKVQSRPAFASVLTYAAYRDFPSAYLMCTKDNAVPYAVQQRFVAMAGISDITEVASGHSPQISQPKAVTLFIRRCAGEVMPRL
ncbi:MAG: hypothetical protein Q9172_004224 [Xanthocarpia lactea]